jgi:predicted metalloprotease
MRWRGGRRSENVEDYRGRRFGGAGLKLGGGGVVVALLLAWFFGVDPQLILGGMEDVQTTQVEPPPPGGVQQTGGPDDELADFVSVVLGDTEDTWTTLFAQQGATYAPPTLVLFSDGVQSACGRAGASVGPFYCPADQKVYIDLGFYRELKDKFQAPGDFAQAYVIAHEVGHHVQNLAGTSEKVRAMQQRGSEEQANALSVRLELQADCYAGVWAHHAERARQILETGDVEEALGAAAAVGDDTIQQRGRGHIVPESFTHGSAEQRMHWFNAGLTNGSLERCDTFAPGSG